MVAQEHASRSSGLGPLAWCGRGLLGEARHEGHSWGDMPVEVVDFEHGVQHGVQHGVLRVESKHNGLSGMCPNGGAALHPDSLSFGAAPVAFCAIPIKLRFRAGNGAQK